MPRHFAFALTLGVLVCTTACSKSGMLPSGLQGSQLGTHFTFTPRMLRYFPGPPNNVGFPNGVVDTNDALYGTASGGGKYGYGELYKVSFPGGGTILHSFSSPGGNEPSGGLIVQSGALYGLTFVGGPKDAGSLFGISSANGQLLFSYTFQGPPKDAACPTGGLTAVGGVLYGASTTGGNGPCQGGLGGCGAVFRLDPSTGKESLIYNFQGGADGDYPNGDLLYLKGDLYGTTYDGGTFGCGGFGCGIVFAVNVSTHKERIVYKFQGGPDGENPASGLIVVGGKLYGVTGTGGVGSFGTLYEIAPSNGTEKILHSFASYKNDGQYPSFDVTYSKGTLYGIAANGGLGSCKYGCGTVYAFDLSLGRYKTLYEFKGGTDASEPDSSLTQIGADFYGTTVHGGATGTGTIFRVDPNGREKVVYSF